ncbi:unnamed protein product, partial [Amoebophrya sp. A25]
KREIAWLDQLEEHKKNVMRALMSFVDSDASVLGLLTEAGQAETQTHEKFDALFEAVLHLERVIKRVRNFIEELKYRMEFFLKKVTTDEELSVLRTWIEKRTKSDYYDRRLGWNRVPQTSIGWTWENTEDHVADVVTEASTTT